jgi:bifunctional DNase/RNase
MYIRMRVAGITIDPLTSMPIIILKDQEENHSLPIWIGLLEATAIATQLEGIEMSRPMTHDLIRNITQELNIKVNRIEVCDLHDNTFFARIHLEHNNKKYDIDSRPSDAIALALRVDADIYVAKEVLDKSSSMDLSQDETKETSKEKLKELLEKMDPDDFGKYKM